MSKKVLVLTDLSTNSKAGMRFGLQMAAQTKASLVFFYCMPNLKPTRWSDARHDLYLKAEMEKGRKALEKFVAGVYKSAGIKKPVYECVVQQRTDIQSAIIKYAVKINADAICMSTRGAGRLKKIIGSRASGIIQKSSVPAYIIPQSYRRSPIKKIFYASDLNQIGSELIQVRNIAKQYKAKVLVYHYDHMIDVAEAQKKLKRVAMRYKYPNVKFKFEKYNIDKSLAYHIKKDMKKSKASLAILFTDQKRGWFDRLFLSSKTVDVAYASNIPLLAIPKE